MKKTTRILTIALVLCMALMMIPAPAQAEGSMLSGGSGSLSGGSSDSSAASATLNAVMKQDAYFRTGPSKSSGTIAGISEVPKGASIAVIDNTSSSEYWKVVYQNTTGYVFASYVKLTGTVSPSAPGVSSGSSSLSGDSSGSTFAAAANAVMKQDAYFRTGPSKSFGTVASISEVPKGASIAVVDNTSSSEYWKVVYKDTTGYVFASYLKLTGTVSAPSSGNSNSLSGGSLSGGGTSSGGSLSGGSSGGSLSGGGLSDGSSDGSSSSSSTVIGVTTKTCNFRVGSSTSSAAVAGCKTISSGKQVSVLDNSATYWKVSYNGYTGWIYGSYVKISSGSTGSSSGSSGSSGGLAYASFSGSRGSSSDRWGSIQVAGTNISAYIYSNAIDSKGNFYYNAYSSSSNYIYALSYLTNPIAVIYGHNMRKSGVGFHQLHHVQNAWLGKSKCEYCGKDCSGARTSVFNISYNGASSWQLVGFFEASSSTISSSATRKSIELMAAMESYRTGSDKQAWIDYLMRYCTSSYNGATLGSVSANDQVMVLVTCADKSGDSYQRMYMLLKAVG